MFAACGGGDTVDLVRDGETVATFCVDFARTADERREGLRGRDDLCAECGLVIEFPQATEACIVNSGVSFDIDVVYADANAGVVAIERDVAAGDATSRCHPDVQWVLEVNAGEAREIAIDDRLTNVGS